MKEISSRPLMSGRWGRDPLTRLGRRTITVVVGSLWLGGIFSVLDVTRAAGSVKNRGVLRLPVVG
jgi:hypothetical protein